MLLPVKTSLSFLYVVGNKAKGRISKGVFQENKEREIFRKTIIFLFSIFIFRKIKHALFSWNSRFEIRPFALLATMYSKKIAPGRPATRIYNDQIFPAFLRLSKITSQRILF